MPSSEVVFKAEFAKKEITKAHPIEIKIICLKPRAFNPSALKRGLTVFEDVEESVCKTAGDEKAQLRVQRVRFTDSN